MSISLIVMVGLPVLYLTGSLRKATTAAGIGGAAFVLYFIICAGLSIIPVVAVTDSVSVCVAGAFLCIAPVIYLIIQKDFTFRFYLASAITVLLSVSASFVSISYTVTYLSAALIFAVSLLALLFMRSRAPLYAPVLIGIYSVAENIMALLTDTVRSVTAFDVMDIASLSFVICLAVSYLLSHPWQKEPTVQT
jgi:hypothetical protein